MTFTKSTVGNGRTCGLTTTKRLYCWGYNGPSGALGQGTTDTAYVTAKQVRY